MNTEKSKSHPIPLHDHLRTLSAQAGKVRADLEKAKQKPAPAVMNELTSLETTLLQIGQKVESALAEHQNLTALANIGQVVNSSLELDEVLRIVMDNIVKLTRAERGFLMLREDSGEMVTRVARNWGQESINASELTISTTIVQRVINSGQPVITTNAQEDQRFVGQESIVAFNLRSILCVPLKVKSDMIGVIYTDNRIRTGIFTDAERDLLVAFANQAAVAIDNARLFSSLRTTLAEVTDLKSLMDNIFASIASGVITADIKDQITLCNRAAEAILGHASIDLIGRRLDEILPSVAAEIGARLIEVRKTDKPVIDLEISHILPERGPVNWRLNLSPLKDSLQTTQGIAIVLDDLTERKKLEAQRRLLERMVSPAVLDQINPDSLQIGGKRVDLTILFADIRGFTPYSEQQTPEQLVSVLNHYLAAAADAVLHEEGTVDKFLGDAVMAWFNAPLPQPDHTLRAVRAALAIRESVAALHRELPERDRLDFGIGLHYGEALLGWIGTQRRLEYTAISDSVNMAKRIQENSAKNQILISKDAYERVKKNLKVSPVAALTVKGKSQPIEVFEVMGLK
jgi:adenylate cyclase